MPCYAQDPPPPFTKSEFREGTGWNATLKIVVTQSDHAKAQGNNLLVTGTNINIVVTSSFVNVVPLPNEPQFNWVKLKIGQIGDDPIKTWENVKTSPVSHDVRFASTHFTDGSTQNIILEGQFHGWTTDNPPVEVTETFTATLPVVIYNKALALTTVESWIPPIVAADPGHYSKPGDSDYPNPPLVPDTAKRIVDDAITKLTGTAMKHTLVPENGDGRNWREFQGPAALCEAMTLATLFFACTHGEMNVTTAGHWRASHTDVLTFSPANANDVKTYVTTKPDLSLRNVPDYTLAMFYACETLNNSSNNPRAFQLKPDIPTYPNKGYAGFANRVHYLLHSPTGETLDEHSKLVLQYMAEGMPLQVALDQVQLKNSPPKRKVPMADNPPYGQLYMIVRGDPYARIVNVYLKKEDYDTVSAEVRNSWFWVKS